MRFLARRRFMREHRFAQRRMSAYLDGDLTADAHHRVEKHVGVCPECRKVLDALRRTVAGLRSLGAEPQPSVADGVIERLRRET